MKNAQAQDLMRALVLLYREMAEELEDRAVFEHRFALLDIDDLAGDAGDIPAWITVEPVGSSCRAGCRETTSPETLNCHSDKAALPGAGFSRARQTSLRVGEALVGLRDLGEQFLRLAVS